MKEINARPDAATGTTTAEKEKLNEIFMMSALNFFADETATNVVCTIKNTETGDTGVVGFAAWSSDNKVIDVEAFHTGGMHPDIASEWFKFVKNVVFPNVGNRKMGGYIHASDRGVIRKERIPLIVKSALIGFHKQEKQRNV